MTADDRMLRVWAQVLDRPVGADDDFFADLNGDSFGALELVAAIGTEYGIDLPIEALFLNPTVARMDDAVAAAMAGARSPGEG